MLISLIDRNICVSGTMAEEVDSSAPPSLQEDIEENNREIDVNNSDIDENRCVNSKFDRLLACQLQDLEKLSENRTEHSTLEILLVLFNVHLNIPHECQCITPALFKPFNIHFLIKFFTLMKDIIEFTSNKISKNLVKDFITDFKSEYQFHLLYLLQISFWEINSFINAHPVPLDGELVSMVNQISDHISILISRHGWHYREEIQQYRTTSRARPYSQRPFRHKIFNYYMNSVARGKFPYIFWQGTPLREKIRQYDSLEDIFSNGKEEICCICMTDEERLKNNFAIFLECKHIVCASCAERLLVVDTKTR